MKPKTKAIRFPTQIIVRGEPWQIEYVECIGKARKHRRLLGRCISWERRIQIDRTATADSMRTTLLHELAHATQVCAPFSSLSPEDFCDYLAGFVADLARHNDLRWLYS